MTTIKEVKDIINENRHPMPSDSFETWQRNISQAIHDIGGPLELVEKISDNDLIGNEELSYVLDAYDNAQEYSGEEWKIMSSNTIYPMVSAIVRAYNDSMDQAASLPPNFISKVTTYLTGQEYEGDFH